MIDAIHKAPHFDDVRDILTRLKEKHPSILLRVSQLGQEVSILTGNWVMIVSQLRGDDVLVYLNKGNERIYDDLIKRCC